MSSTHGRGSIAGMVALFSIIVCVAPHLHAQSTSRKVSEPESVPYASDRKLFASEFERFDWKDAARDRVVPAKIYFPTKGDGPFPVVIFSHGLGGNREAYEYLGRQWAAHGYVVVHLQHPGSDTKVLISGNGRPMDAMRAAANLQNSVDRAKDVHLAIDQLEAVNKDDAKLKGKLDLKSIGVAGHSFGAQTAMLVAGQRLGKDKLSDERVKCVIPMSEPVPMLRVNLDEIYKDVHVPTFFMTGTKDDSPIGETSAKDRRVSFDHTNASPTFLLTFNGGDHMIFSGRFLRAADGIDDAAFQKQIRLSSTAFWDAYLKGDDAAKKWLNEGDFKQELGDLGVLEQK